MNDCVIGYRLAVLLVIYDIYSAGEIGTVRKAEVKI